MFSRTAAIIVLAASAVFVAAAPTGVDYAPMVTVRSATRGPLSGSPALGGIAASLGGIAVPLNGITQCISGPLSDAAGGLAGCKGLGGLGL